MPDISFGVETITIAPEALLPALLFQLRLASDGPVESILLRCQIQIEAPRRRYTQEEKERLQDLFGEPDRWSQTMRPILWTNVSAKVPPFERTIIHALAVPCTFDRNEAACKYLEALDGGDVPVTLLFRGTVFYRVDAGALQARPISWNQEARTKLAVPTWRSMMRLNEPLETA